MYEKFIAEHFGNLHHKGFRYIVRLCELYAEDERHKITGLYYQIASEFDESYSRVERCLRKYIEDMPSWELPVKINKMTIAEVVPAIVYCVKKEKPSNGKLEDLAWALAYDFACVGCQHEKSCHDTCYYENCADFQKFNEKLLEAFDKLNGGA